MDFDFIVPFGADDGDDSPPPEEKQDEKQPPADDSKSKSNKDDDDDEDDDEFSGYSAKELRRIAKDLSSGKKTAEKEKIALKNKVDEEERKKRTDNENLTNDLSTEREANKVLRATVARLGIVNAIICDNKYEWHNPEIVAQQLNSEIVKIGDDGKVEGLRKELERVAKEHSYLLKKKQDDNSSGSGGPTGFKPGNQGGSQSGAGDKPDLKEMAKIYPALASRM